MTRKDFISFFNTIWSFKLDLEDGLVQELNYIREDAKDMKSKDDYKDLAEDVNILLNEYGYPTIPLN